MRAERPAAVSDLNRGPIAPKFQRTTKRRHRFEAWTTALWLAVALVLPDSAFAREWVVDARGGADFSSVQPAVDAAASGDTILIRSGRHPGRVVIGGKHELTLRGEPGAVLAPPERNVEGGIEIETSSRIVVEGLDVLLRSDDAVRISSCKDVQLRGCRISGDDGGEGIAIFRGQRILVAGSSVVGQRGTGISVDASTDIEVADTVVADNGRSGIFVKKSAAVTLRGDTVARHSAGPGVLLEDSSGVTVTRSILVFNGRDERQPGEADIAASENYREDPHFADLVKRDYRLRPSSPLAGKAARAETRVGALGVAAEVTTPYCPFPVDTKNAVGRITPLGASADGKFAYFDHSPFSPADDAAVEVVVYDSRKNAELFSRRLSDFDPKRSEGLWAGNQGFHELFARHGIDCSRPPQAEPMPVRLGESAAVQVEAARESDKTVAFFAWTEGKARLRLGRFDSANEEMLPGPLSPAEWFFRHPGSSLLTLVFAKQDSVLFFSVDEAALAPEKMAPRCGPEAAAPADENGFTHFVSGDKALLREEPGTKAKVLGELEHNDHVRVLGDASCEEETVSLRDGDGVVRRIADRWYRVSTYARVGWIHGALIEPVAHRGHDGHVFALEFSPDGKLLASGGSHGDVLVWDLKSGVPRARLQVGSSVRDLAFDGTGRLAVATEQGGAQVWDWAAGKRISGYTSGSDWAWAVDFSPDGRHVVSVQGGGVHVWRADTGALVAKAPKESQDGRVAVFVGNDTVAYSDGPVVLWGFGGKDAPRKLALTGLGSMASDSKGEALLLGKGDQRQDFFYFDPRGELKETELGAVEARTVRYLPARRSFAVASCNDGVVFWPRPGERQPSGTPRACAEVAALGEDGRRVLLATLSGRAIVVTDVEQPQAARKLPATRLNE